MKFTVEVPIFGDLENASSIATLVQSLDRSGYDELGYTEHPAPSKKWIQGGGHETFDPFAALSFAAALTTNIRLQTYLAVLPYRKPLMLAKSVASVDRLSDGRFTLVVGTGYLRSEFAALGLDLDDRNRASDEVLDVLTKVFTTDEFTYEGSDWKALGVIYSPGPIQLPHPPIWIGGSSRKSRERAAKYGQGWAPLMASEVLAKTTRSARMDTMDALAASMDDMKVLLEQEGRAPGSIAIQLDAHIMMDEALSQPDDHLELLGRFDALGITHIVARPPKASIGEIIEVTETYAEAFLSDR